MSLAAWRGILIPFLGTSLGASSVFFLGKSPHPLIQRGLTGFAAGVMVAASVWSLLIPAMEQAAQLAALHSRAKDSSQVPVDYTQIRHVSKPAGAKPGMVVYVQYKTVFVTPGEPPASGQ